MLGDPSVALGTAKTRTRRGLLKLRALALTSTWLAEGSVERRQWDGLAPASATTLLPSVPLYDNVGELALGALSRQGQGCRLGSPGQLHPLLRG